MWTPMKVLPEMTLRAAGVVPADRHVVTCEASRRPGSGGREADRGSGASCR